MKPTTYRPFSPAFRNLFDDFFGKPMSSFFGEDDHFTTPAVNVRESDQGFHLEVAAPGMDKKDFHIAVENGILSISSEKRESAEDQTDTYTRREFHYRSFKRSFHLPEGVVETDIKATYTNGVLTVDLPKEDKPEIEKGRVIEIS